MFSILSGAWKGPTVLLAPAHFKMVKYSGWMEAHKIQAPPQTYIHIVHGKNDTLIPIKDSHTFSETALDKTHLKLTVQDDDHRLTKTSTAEYFKEIIDEAWEK